MRNAATSDRLNEYLGVLQLGAAGLDGGLQFCQLFLVCFLGLRQPLLQSLHLNVPLLPTAVPRQFTALNSLLRYTCPAHTGSIQAGNMSDA